MMKFATYKRNRIRAVPNMAMFVSKCFFTRSLFICTTVFWLIAAWIPELRAEITTVHVVRHAEKAGTQGDVPLSAAGIERAFALRDLLSVIPLSAVFATATKRTQQTALPTAKASRVQVSLYGDAAWTRNDLIQWVKEKSAVHAGQNMLIVGHSNTVPVIVEALTGTNNGLQIVHQDYANLFTIVIEDDKKSLETSRYGILPQAQEGISISGDLHESKDISGVVAGEDFLVVASDEGASVQFLNRHGQSYQAQPPVALHATPDMSEVDIEGLARHGDIFYAIGSHSWRRKNIYRKKDRDKSYAKIKKRYETVEAQPKRNALIRFQLDLDTGNLVPGTSKTVSLATAFDENDTLKRFRNIASKENGIDIEGIAVDEQDRLYLGFRGPVLRANFVPVLTFSFSQPTVNELRYVKLDGRGIRDIVRVKNGFLLIAGSVGDLAIPYRLYFWDGNDCLSGKREYGDLPQGQTVLLGSIPILAGAKAEGITVLEETVTSYRVLIVYDGISGGEPTVLEVLKPLQP